MNLCVHDDELILAFAATCHAEPVEAYTLG
jgi:hypothetical protein